jgi:hypothetical protein
MWPYGYLYGMCAFAAGVCAGTGWVVMAFIFGGLGLIFSLIADDKN